MGSHNKGAITVYLSILLSALVLLSGILMDIVRIRAAEIQLRRAANTAAVSVLAGYNSKLKEEFGLFALHNGDLSYLQNEVKDYMMNSLITNPASVYLDRKVQRTAFVDIYNYRIENLSVTPLYNFTENEITRQQIIEFMKYRGPAQLTENFLDKVKETAKIEAQTTAYKKKLAIEKKLAKIEKEMLGIQANITIMNRFSKSSFDNKPSSGSRLITLLQALMEEGIYNQCRYADFEAAGEHENEENENLQEELEHLYENAQKLADEQQEILLLELEECLAAGMEAKQLLYSIQTLSQQLKKDLAELKSEVQKLDTEASAFQKDLDSYERLLDVENSQSLNNELDRNIEVLNNLGTSISGIRAWVRQETEDLRAAALERLEESIKEGEGLFSMDNSQLEASLRTLSRDFWIREMNEEALRYSKLPMLIDKSKKKKGKDPRKDAADTAKQLRNQSLGNTAKPKTIENMKLLPSYLLEGRYPNKVFSDSITGLMDSKGSSMLLERFDVNFNDESTFAEEGYDYITEFAKKLKLASEDVRDELYVNEYIFHSFKDAVEIESASTDGKSSVSFFEKAEVEYILAGYASEAVNQSYVKGQLLLIRFGMNTLHIYGDAEKRTLALEVATAAAGFTGFGIPIVHNLIMCAWGTAEAVEDVSQIYKGKSVPFIKTKSSWKTNLLSTGFTVKRHEAEQINLMSLDYHDYLRLLLLIEDSDQKMNRIEDLIEMNMQQSSPQFRLSSCNTYLRVNAEASIKYWFITKLFIPSKYKTADGRHKIWVEVWRGY